MIRVKLYTCLLLSFMLYSCIEPFVIEEEVFESALVIEATITNEFKQQEIKLSRTFAVDTAGLNPELNASVLVNDGLGNSYVFSESEPGLYLSDEAFLANENVDYSLSIVTSNGREYESKPARFISGASTISNLSARTTVNDLGEEGVGIFIDSSDPTGNSRYYRYTFEETTKLIAPRYVGNFLAVIDAEAFLVELQARQLNVQVCYRTETSKSIILTSTANLTEDVVSNFQTRFLLKDNPTLGTRYSILVNQYTQSRDAFVFYNTLKDFSNTGSIFSQIQPGFINGNVFSATNRDEKVIGFFDVSPVVSQRLFFNYRDFYDDAPPYAVNCNTLFAPELKTIGCTSPLIDALLEGIGIYVSENGDDNIGSGPYALITPACGDCTVLGTVIEPDFWIE